jgi:hypothetical protein
MTIAYIILAHKCPEYLGRLLNALSTESTNFIIHIDKDQDMKPFKDSVARVNVDPEKIHYANRVRCRWADISLVQATIKCLETLREKNLKYDYAVLLSGQDYPLKCNEYIEEFLSNSNGAIYIDVFGETTYTKAWQRLIFEYRYNAYSFFDNDKWYALKDDGNLYNISAEGVAYHKKAPKDVVDKYTFPRKLPLYIAEKWGGNQWWMLPRSVVNYILKFLKEHPRLYHIPSSFICTR